VPRAVNDLPHWLDRRACQPIDSTLLSQSPVVKHISMADGDALVDRLSLGPYFTAAARAGRQEELPRGVWQEILRLVSVRERFVVSMVCRALRSHALSMLTPDLEVCLTSGGLFINMNSSCCCCCSCWPTLLTDN
jgi:hypothetical protein